MPQVTSQDITQGMLAQGLWTNVPQVMSQRVFQPRERATAQLRMIATRARLAVAQVQDPGAKLLD